MMPTTLSIIINTWSIVTHLYAQQPSNEYDVIIMGAGGAGIAAAKTLYEANITNILIIEAQWYIGGRAVVHHFSDYMLNVGASWIGGACITPTDCSAYTEVNPMLTAAYKYNISWVVSDYIDGIILDFGGNEHNITDTNNRFDAFNQASSCAWSIMEDKTRLNPDDMSYQAALRLCGWSKPLNAIDKTIQWLNYEFESGEHAKWRSATSYGINSHTVFGPDDLFITDARGYQGILKALAREFLDIDDINNEEKIILNSPITEIQYDENGVTVTLDDNNNNTQYSAKYGIVTFSLGVLQSDIVEFVPKLPSWKIDALLAFNFPVYTPILVKWPYNFWNDKVGDDAEFIIFNDDRFGFFPWVYNLDHPNLYNGSLIWRFDVSLDLAQSVCYENINDTIKQIVDLKLSYYFDNVPYPDDIFVASWHSNKYVQGGYSQWPVGVTYDQKRAIRSPLFERLFFAGEAITDWGGYVHSAWIDGNETANKIMACMGYDPSLTNDFECPQGYIPSSDDDDCKTDDLSVLQQLAWLWIVLGILLGVALGYLFAMYCSKVGKNKGASNYGSLDDMDVPMQTQSKNQP